MKFIKMYYIMKIWKEFYIKKGDEKLIDCITAINGYNLETLEDVLYYFTGYQSFDQLEDFDEEKDYWISLFYV